MYGQLCLVLFTIDIVWYIEAGSHSLVGNYSAQSTDEFSSILYIDGEAVDSDSSKGEDRMPHRNWMREGHSQSVWRSIKHQNADQWDGGGTDILKNLAALHMSGSHSLVGTYTALNTEEFSSILYIDGEAVDSYSSKGEVRMPHRNWTRKGHGQSVWRSIKRRNADQWDRGRTDILKNYAGLNMSGAAVLQGRFGCEIEQNPDVRVKRSFAQYGWNGEDFLSYNLTRHQWEASAEAAVPIERKWNGDQDILKRTKIYLENICVVQLLDALFFEAKESQNISQPNATVFVKRYLNTGKVILTFLVSGFRCSSTITVKVYQDEDILTEEGGLLSSGIRPNGDGTCQLRESLDISNSTVASYSCEVHYGNLSETVRWDLERRDLDEPRQDFGMRHHFWLLIVLAVLLFVFIFFVLMPRCRRHTVQRGHSVSMEPMRSTSSS